jgi:hypothetical protein
MAGGAASPSAIRGRKAQYLQASFISGSNGQFGRGADFSPKGRFFSEPLDCAGLVRF